MLRSSPRQDAHFRDTLPDAVTLSQQFIKADYFTARVGKIYHYNVPASIGTDGFDDAPSWQKTVNPKGRDKTDGMVATEVIKMMREKKDEPFFIAAGFFRPHSPFIAPKKYFDLYPLEDLRLPYTPDGDRDDIPTAAFAHNNPIPNYNIENPHLLCSNFPRTILK